jgi:hypothetical protein
VLKLKMESTFFSMLMRPLFFYLMILIVHRILNLLLCGFEQMSGLKGNFLRVSTYMEKKKINMYIIETTILSNTTWNGLHKVLTPT